MADKFLNLLDITKLSGSDQAVGLVEEVNTVAPELNALAGVPINGITYKITRRTALPQGPAFRNANEGTDVVSSTFAEETGSCYFMDGQMQVDEAIVKAAMAEGRLAADILATEAAGMMQEKLIKVGDQFYRGTTADSKGFAGLQALYDSTNCEVSAAGSSGSATSAWLIWNNPKGLHWIWGNNAGVEMGEWAKQQVTDSSDKKFMAWVNNASGYIGLRRSHTKSIVRIKLITSAKPLTDELVAQALTKMPIFMRSSPGLKLFCNSTAAFYLQKSRTPTVGKVEIGYPGQPTESNGVPIVLTDSIPNTE